MSRFSLTSAPLRMAGYAMLLALSFVAAFGIGAANGPVGARDAPAAHGNDAAERDGGAGTAGPVPGLATSDAGFTLVPRRRDLSSGGAVPYQFSIEGPDGSPLRAYRTTHEKELHLIAVRRDMSGFQHVHPSRASDGTWTVPLDVTTAGSYRVFADFAPAGFDGTLTLGTDLSVAGDFAPVPLPVAATTASVDGYAVALSGRPSAGGVSDLTFTLTRDGREVTDLQPYLGAFGHLVSLRAGDLAYLHTHPVAEAHGRETGGPAVRFGAEFPTSGSYRLFLNFQVDGTVRTAELTVEIP